MIKYHIVAVLVALLGTSCSSHPDPVPLRGYTCKQNAQRPCSLCPVGYYCSDKDSMLPCGDVSVYCPVGSVKPTPVSQGYFTTGAGDEEDKRSSQLHCVEGFYCAGGVRRECPKGFYCPDERLNSPIECGNSSVFCHVGSSKPMLVREGFFSIGGTNTTRNDEQSAPPGHYASDGIVKPCPEGHFGDRRGLYKCSEECDSGWFCPPASISNRQIACGSEDRFCPPGSASPKQVRLGYYTSTEEEPCRPGTYREQTPDVEVDVSPIATSRMEGTCIQCPDGTYKPFSGDDFGYCFSCSTKAKSTPDKTTCECHQSATERAFFKLNFHPIEKKCYNFTDGLVPPDDFHGPETQFTKSKEMPCEKGHFCLEGTRYKCPGGRYGDKSLETNEQCAGECEEGHWCGEASTRPTQNKCGSPNVYCTPGIATPIYVSEGYYTNEDEPDDMKTSQQICPRGYWCENGLRHPCEAGSFGETLGLSAKSCDTSCMAGYFCPSASTSAHQIPCGNSTVYCPEGSSEPSRVELGYYSASESDVVVADFYAGPNSTHQMQVICEKGFYCRYGVKYSCPAGTFGWNLGAFDVSGCVPCIEGYYCPSPTTSDSQVPCGEAHRYCPKGSPEPLNVDLGYYSVNERNAEEGIDPRHVRTAQVECEPGFYCQHGIRSPCPKGTFGKTGGLASDSCSGLCPRSFFCPLNSVNPLPCSPGAFASGGAKECTSCEIPLTVPWEVVNTMCRDDRSCCLDVFE